MKGGRTEQLYVDGDVNPKDTVDEAAKKLIELGKWRIRVGDCTECWC